MRSGGGKKLRIGFSVAIAPAGADRARTSKFRSELLQVYQTQQIKAKLFSQHRCNTINQGQAEGHLEVCTESLLAHKGVMRAISRLKTEAVSILRLWFTAS